MRRFLSSICLGGILLAGAGIGTAFAQGASSYITNSTNLLTGGNFNIDGLGKTGTLSVGVGYTTPGTFIAAIINAITSGTNSNATGLTITASSTGTGLSTGLSSYGIGDEAGYHVGVLGSANATTTDVNNMIGGNWTRPFAAGIVGFTPDTGADKYAGYFLSQNNTPENTTLNVSSNPGNSITPGSEMFAAIHAIGGNDGSAAADGTQLYAEYNYSEGDGPDVQARGSLSEAQAESSGLGASAGIAQASGTTGLADYTPNPVGDAPTTDYIVGVRGATYTEDGRTNGLNVVGMTYDGALFHSVGGYFFPTLGTVANLGVVGQVGGNPNDGWQDATFNGTDVGVAGINYNTGDAEFSGYFHSNNGSPNGSAVRIENNITGNFTAGNAPFGGEFYATGTDGDPGDGSSHNAVGTLGGAYSNASTTSGTVQTQGLLGEAATYGSGLGTPGGGYTQAIGLFGLADYDNNTNAGATDYLEGVGASPNINSTGAITGIAFSGDQYADAGFYRMIAGYFRAGGGTVNNASFDHANIGSLSQVGGTKNQGWQDVAFNRMNVAVAGIDYNPASDTDRAMYTSGAVQMVGLTGTGTKLVTIDASGNLGSETAPAAPPTGVYYDVTSQQATATVGTDNLFNVGYSAANTNTAASGAVINSLAGATTGAASATALTLTATANSTGAVTTTGLNVSATGNTSNTGSSNLGIVATSNATSGQLTTLESGLSTEANSTAEAIGASILAYNPNDGDHQYAGYFAGNNSNQGPAYASGVVRVVNNITAAIPGNNSNAAGQPTAGFFTLTDNNSGSGASGNQAAPITLYAEATGESSPYTKVTGVFGHAWSKSPNGQTASGTMARAMLGFADGQNLTAATGTNVIGVMGWTNGETSAEDNLLSVVGEPFPGMGNSSTVPTDVGGYFFGSHAHTTNLGMVAQVGGSTNDGWQDAGITGKNVAVTGFNYNNAAGATGMAGYFAETGDMTNTASSNLGVVATSNATSAQLSTLESGLSTEANSTAEAVGASILAYNPNDGDHQYAGYFAGNNSNQGPAYASGVLRVVNTITAAIPGNNNDNAGQPSAGFFSLTDNNSGSGASGNQAAPITLYAEATGESSPYTKVTGVFGHAWSKSPNGQTASGTMARAILGFADGQNLTAATGTKVIGLLGWINGESGAEDNLLSVVGVPYPGMSPSSTVPTVVGGYFFGNDAHTTNLGTVGQVGGSTDQAWQDANITGMNAAVVGIDYNTASATDLAGYFGGNVVTTGSVTTGNHVIVSTSGTASDGGSGVTVTDVPVFIITGAGGGSITMPGSPATGDVIIVINNSSSSVTYAGTVTDTIGSGNSRTFYWDGSHWQ